MVEEKLRTLKEMPRYNFAGVRMEHGVAVDIRNLQAEAVKWVKMYKEIVKQGGPMYNIAIAEFMSFFNLTEEDLV